MKKNLKSLALGASLMMALAACSQAAGSGNVGDVKRRLKAVSPASRSRR